MNKKCRILLYVLSIVMVAGCIAAVARTKESTPEVKVPGEEPAAVVSGEDTEHAGRIAERIVRLPGRRMRPRWRPRRRRRERKPRK